MMQQISAENQLQALEQTTIDQSLIPTDVPEMEANLIRLYNFSMLSRLQHDQKLKKLPSLRQGEPPIDLIPVNKAFLDFIGTLVPLKDKMWLHLNTYEHHAIAQNLQAISREIRALVRLHKGELSVQQLTDCIEIVKLVTKDSYKNPPAGGENYRFYRWTTLRDDMNLIDLHLSSTYMELASLKPNEKSEILGLAKLAIKLIQDNQLCERFMETDPTYRTQYVQLLRESFCDFPFDESHNSITIATQKLKLQEEMTNAESVSLYDMTSQLLFIKTIKDMQSFRQAIVVSLRALLVLTKHRQIDLTVHTELKSTPFLPQVYKLLNQTDDENLARLLISILSNRLSQPRYCELDFNFYMEQFTAEDDEPQNFSPDKAHLHQLLKQILSIRCQYQESEFSAFDQSAVTVTVDDGPLHKTLATNPRVQHAVYNFLNMTQIGPSSPLMRVPKNKFFKRKWNQLVYETLSEEPIAYQDGFIIHQTYHMLVKCLLTEKNRFADADNQTLHMQMETLLQRWIEYLNQSVYCLSTEDSDSVVELIDHSRKCQVLALIIKYYTSKNQANREAEWGQRITESKILQMINDQVLPKCQSDEEISPVLVQYVMLISEIIDNEPNLIRILLKQGDDQSGIINNLLTTLKHFQIKRVKMYPQSETFKTVTKFLGRLALTEQGCASVFRNGPTVVRHCLEQTKLQKATLKPDYEFLEICPATERLFQIDEVCQVIREHITECMKEAQTAATIVNEHHRKILADCDYSRSVAGYFIQFPTPEHISILEELPRLIANLRCLNIKDPRQKRREYNHHEFARPQQQLEQSLTKIFRQPGNFQCILEQRSDLFQLMETCHEFEIQVNIFVHIIRTLIIEALPPKQSKDILEQAIKDSINTFSEASNLMQTKCFDQLKCGSDNKLKFDKMLLYCQYSYLSRDRDCVIRRWSTQDIQQLMQFGRLQCKKWFDSTVKEVIKSISGDMYGQAKTNTRCLKVKDDDLTTYVPLVKQLEKMHSIIRKQLMQSLAMKSSQEQQFPFAILSSIQSVAIPEEFRREREREQSDSKDKQDDQTTLIIFGETLAEISNQILIESDPNQMIEWCGHNESIIQLLGMFLLGDKMPAPQHISFIHKNGLQPLCQLYKALLQKQSLLINLTNQTMVETESQREEEALLKSLILAQKEAVVKLILSFVQLKEKRRSAVNQYHQFKISDYTKGRFTSLKHFLSNQYNILFTELLDWQSEVTESHLVLQPRTQNYDSLLESVIKAFSQQSWKLLDQREDARGMFGRLFEREREGPRNQRNNQPLPQREVTPAELAAVTALGFDEYMSRMAIRMANFNTERAIDILLSNEPGLLQFIAQDNTQRQQKEVKKAEPDLKTETDVDMVLPASLLITESEFEDRVKNYGSRLLYLLLETKHTTVIDQELSLKTIKQLSKSLDPVQTWRKLFLKLADSEEGNLPHLLGVILLFLQTSKPKLDQITPMEQICEQAKSLLANLDKPNAQDSLYYLCLFIYKASSIEGFITDETSQVSLQVLSSDANALTKDLVLMTVYSLLVKVQQEPEAGQKALECVKNVESNYGDFMSQLQRIALYSSETAEMTCLQVIQESFVAMTLHKRDLVSKLKSPTKELSDTQLAQQSFTEVMRQLQIITQDTSVIKSCLEKNCIIFKQNSKVLVKPKPDFITAKLLEQLSLAADIKYLKKNQDIFNQTVEEADLKFSEKVQENEKQVVELLIKSIDNCEPKMLEKRVESQLILLARWTRAFPHLLTLLKMPSYKDFSNWFLTISAKLCLENQPLKFDQKLSLMLTPLLGYNQFTPLNEFSLRYNIKIQLLNQACAHLNLDLSQSEYLGYLSVIKSLTVFDNCYEFNRVVLSSRYYYDSIEYLVTQTDFLQTICNLVQTLGQEQRFDGKVLQVIFDIVQAICSYAQQLKDEKVQQETQVEESKQVEQSPSIQQPPQQQLADDQDIMQVDQDAQQVQQDPIQQDDQSSNEDEEENDEEDDQMDDYDEDQQEEGFEEGRSSSYYDDDDEDEQANAAEAAGVHFMYPPHRDRRQENQQQNDILRRPVAQAQAQRGEASHFRVIGGGQRGWGDPIEIRGFGDRIFSSSGVIHRGEVPQAQVRFTDQWTQQEQLAQNVLHQLYTEDPTSLAQQDPQREPANRFQTCTNCFMPGHSTRECPQSRDARINQVPKSVTEIKERYRSPKLNKMSEKFDCLQPIDKMKLLKLLQENIKEFSAKSAPKKLESIQFRSYGALHDRETIMSTSTLMRQHIREVIESGSNDTIEERLRIMEAHMEMLIHGERDNERMVIHHHMDREEREEPVDLIGGEVLDRESQIFGQPNLGDQLLQQLQQAGQIEQPPADQVQEPRPADTTTTCFRCRSGSHSSRECPLISNVGTQADTATCSRCLRRGHFTRDCPQDFDYNNPFMLPRRVNDELPGLFNSLELLNPFQSLLPQVQQRPPQQELQQQPRPPQVEEQKRNEIAPVDALEMSDSSSSLHSQPLALIEDVQLEPVQQEQQFSYGYPHSVLIENDIDPAILPDLPDEVRVELLSTVNWQAAALPNISQQQPAMQSPSVELQQQIQQPVAQQSNQAADIGIDQDFLANLPQEIRQEILENERLRNQNLGRPEQQRQAPQATGQDAATLLATVTDPALRIEVLLNLAPSTIQTLPENLRQEAQQAQQNARQERVQQRQEIQRMHAAREMGGDHPFRAGGMFDRPPPYPYPNFQGQGWQPYNRHRYLDEEHNDDIQWLNDMYRDRELRKETVKTIEDVELLQISADQCYFRLTTTDKQFLIRSDKSILQLVESHLGQPLLAKLLTLFIQLTQSKNKETKLNLLPMINALTQVHSNGIKMIIEWLITNYEQSFAQLDNNGDEVQVQSLVMVSALRLLIQMNKKVAQQVFTDFLFPSATSGVAKVELQVILDHLSILNSQSIEKNDVNKKALARNLQQALNEILSNANQEAWTKRGNQAITEQTILNLTQILDLQITDTQLIHSVGKALLRISRQKTQHLVLIVATCRSKQLTAQKCIVTGLQQVLKKLEGQEIDVDECKSPHSLHYSLSQHSQNSHIQPIQIDTKTKITVEALTTVESALKETQKDLICVRQISQILTQFKAQAEKGDQGTSKSQIHILNQILQFLKGQKNLKPFMSVLKQHIGCIFEFNQVELNKITETSDKKNKESAIKMQPVRAESKSSKQKICTAVFKNVAPDISDQLYEFCKLCMINKQIINKIFTTPSSDSSTFSLSTFVKAMPNLLNFENKRAFFRKEIDKMKKEGLHRHSTSIKIRRKEIFTEAYAQLGQKPASDLKGRLHIDFVGEAGIDAGGLARDFFIELSRSMFNPNYSLFKLTSNGVTYYPNDQSFINPDHLNYFRFVGRIIGKALFDGHLLECYFSKPLYKMMVGDELAFEDQNDLDDDAYRGYKWALENDITDHEMYFCVDTDHFGKIEHRDLIEGGVDVKVTNENKLEYFQRLGVYKMYTMIKEQVDAFLKGFHELIPKNLVQIFSHSELELLISGLPDFNLSDLRANTEYIGYSQESQQVRWLWQILASASKEEIGRFLQFVTGSSRIPLEGFRALQGSRGPQRFTLKRIEDTNRLPVGHTCFNSLDLPEYPTKEILKEKLLFAVMETSDFGIA